MPPLRLIQDIHNRWNSTFYMLSRIVKMKRSLTIFLSEYESITFLNSTQFAFIEKLVLFLISFEEISSQLSADKTLLYFVLPAIKALKSSVGKNIK